MYGLLLSVAKRILAITTITTKAPLFGTREVVWYEDPVYKLFPITSIRRHCWRTTTTTAAAAAAAAEKIIIAAVAISFLFGKLAAIHLMKHHLENDV